MLNGSRPVELSAVQATVFMRLAALPRCTGAGNIANVVSGKVSLVARCSKNSAKGTKQRAPHKSLFATNATNALLGSDHSAGEANMHGASWSYECQGFAHAALWAIRDGTAWQSRLGLVLGLQSSCFSMISL